MKAYLSSLLQMQCSSLLFLVLLFLKEVILSKKQFTSRKDWVTSKCERHKKCYGGKKKRKKKDQSTFFSRASSRACSLCRFLSSSSMQFTSVPISSSTSWTSAWYSAFKIFQGVLASVSVYMSTHNQLAFPNVHLEDTPLCSDWYTNKKSLLPGIGGHGSFRNFSADSMPARSFNISSITPYCWHMIFCFCLQSYLKETRHMYIW